MDKLTDKQETFCREYMLDLNATRAAIRAGYSEKTAKEQGARLLSNVNIQSRLSELISERNKRNDKDADYVLQQAVKIHERCMQEVRPRMMGGEPKIDIDEDGICSYVYEFDASNAIRSLELIGKHVDIQAFIDKKKVDHTTDGKEIRPISIQVQSEAAKDEIEKLLKR